MRWHFIGGIFSTLFGIFFIVAGLGMIGTMAYNNIIYGPIGYSNGEYAALDQIALTWKNILRPIFALQVGIGFSLAAICWFKKRNRIALSFFVFACALSGISTAFLRN